jgi:hypothetical protein
MVVVVRDRSPLWAVIAAVLLILVAVSILLIITGGRGTVFVIAIPGFPPESIAIGLLLGVVLVILKRRPIRLWSELVNEGLSNPLDSCGVLANAQICIVILQAHLEELRPPALSIRHLFS